MPKCHFCDRDATGESDTREGVVPTCDLCGGILEPMTDRELRLSEVFCDALPTMLDGIMASCYAGIPVDWRSLAWRSTK